ncbi:unnamed protein product [Caenorhabditis sp. 36 PRJEB53466]|nr:unnamed protein product [Caenorhabditis sp. 36 PRJEB53466]
MLKTLIISLCLGAKVHAGSIAPSIFTSTAAAQEGHSLSSANTSSFFDVELAKIAATCLTFQNYEQLAGNIVRHGVARSSFGAYLVRESVATIGLAEMRAALAFAPPRPWQYFNDTKPSEDELSATPTIEAYYDLREPRSLERSLNSTYLLEHNMISAIAYLDKRFPQNPGLTDRKIVDRLIDEFVAIKRKAHSAIRQMFARGEECLDVVD